MLRNEEFLKGEKIVRSILKKYEEDENKHPWNGDNRHYYLCASSANVCYDYETMVRRGEIYFPSLKEAEKAVEEAGSENVLRYYLKVIR